MVFDLILGHQMSVTPGNSDLTYCMLMAVTYVWHSKIKDYMQLVSGTKSVLTVLNIPYENDPSGTKTIIIPVLETCTWFNFLRASSLYFPCTLTLYDLCDPWVHLYLVQTFENFWLTCESFKCLLCLAMILVFWSIVNDTCNCTVYTFTKETFEMEAFTSTIRQWVSLVSTLGTVLRLSDADTNV